MFKNFTFSLPINTRNTKNDSNLNFYQFKPKTVVVNPPEIQKKQTNLHSKINTIQNTIKTSNVNSNVKQNSNSKININTNINIQRKSKSEQKHQNYFDVHSLDDFRKNVREFTMLTLEIKRLERKIEPVNELIKEHKHKKKTLKDKILYFMNANKLDVCNLPKDLVKSHKDVKGGIRVSNSVRKKTLNDKTLKTNIEAFFIKNKLYIEDPNVKLEDKIDTLFKYIIEHKEKVQIKSIRTINNVKFEEEMNELMAK